jgi:plasmid stabilization system protein ParE
VKSLRVDSAAREELLHEAQYLERARPTYGKKFVAEIKTIFAQIKRNPQAGKPDDEGCRRLRVKDFSFSVVFREEPTEVVVYVIRSDSRMPGYWHARLRNEA